VRLMVRRTIELRLNADELRAIAERLGDFIPKRLYLNVWRQIEAQVDRIKAAPLLAPDPIHMPGDDPEQFLDWLRSNGFRVIADRAVTLPAPGDGPYSPT
jgi:hypothetical protein